MTHPSILSPMTLIAGPCVIEDEGLVLEIAQELKHQCSSLPVQLYFKASFDKANRSSIDSFRGPGLKAGLKILETVRHKTGLPLLTDIHTPEQAQPVAEIVDFLQIPAFLCRQTDLIIAATQEALTRGRRLNLKKGQFLAPWDARNLIEKVRSIQTSFMETHEETLHPAMDWFCMTERGTSFGYNRLVVDMISFQCMQKYQVPVLYDATHSIQTPGTASGGKSTGGERQYLEVLARAAIAAGADGVFMECHPRPDQAKSDGPNAFYLESVGAFVQQLVTLRSWIATQPKLLPEAQ